MKTELSFYEPPQPKFWQGRKDSLPGERFFQHVLCQDIQKNPLHQSGNEWVIAGFCSDEGVRRNEGRVGAKYGPEHIRQQLGKLACHTDKTFIDVGNIVCQNQALEDAQQSFAKLIAYAHQHGKKTIAFGGGHEIAWPHFHGLSSHYSNIGIINFDAHFDLRPMQQEQGSSGTPFWQIKQYCQQNKQDFHYCCLGIQDVANTKSLFQQAHDWSVDYLTAEQIYSSHNDQQKTFLDRFLSKNDAVYVTLCLDVLAECFAPGVSAPQTMGLMPWQVLFLLKYILQSGKVVSLDVAELSPPLDTKDTTARLAAMILAELINKGI